MGLGRSLERPLGTGPSLRVVVGIVVVVEEVPPGDVVHVAVAVVVPAVGQLQDQIARIEDAVSVDIAPGVDTSALVTRDFDWLGLPEGMIGVVGHREDTVLVAVEEVLGGFFGIEWGARLATFR